MKTNTDDFFAIVDSLGTLEEADQVSSGQLEGYIALFLQGRGPEAQKSRVRCATAVRALKNRLHPLQTNTEARALLDQHENAKSDKDRQDLQSKYVRLSHALMESEEGALYSRVAGAFDRLLAPVLALDHGAGRSNRARRAKAAETVLTQNAGLSGAQGEVEGDTGAVDSHGNMIGSDWDLGRDGSYDGLKVVILQEYVDGSFSGELPVRALRDKGFDVVHRLTRGEHEAPTVSELDEELENASQVWIISGGKPILSEEHLDVIVGHWQLGLGVYIFGDNQPWFVDANRLLAKMSLYMVESSAEEELAPDAVAPQGTPLLRLSGNVPGGQTVRARSSESDLGPGFVPNHLLVTGIVGLFEGVTIAWMDKDIAIRLGFKEILREHSGSLVVVAREAMGGFGPVIVDGAFTKLYCHWGLGGSARFVRNCACWLSTLLDEETVAAVDQPTVAVEAPLLGEETVAAVDRPTVAAPVELNLEGSFSAECSISRETGPTALLARQLGDVEQNTTDFSLDNNLALGRRNLVLGSQPLDIAVAKLFLQQGLNPFTRCPVAAIVPIVKLSDEGNLKLVTEIANQLFMGGRAMNRHSLNILLSVCEEMLHRQPDCPEALQFFIREILRFGVSTVDMLKGIPGGPTVPLEQGLRNNIALTGEFVPLRKAFSHVACIVRLLANHASDAQRLPQGTLRLVARRSLLKTLIGAAGRVAKLEGDGGEGLGAVLKKDLDQLLFDQQLGIPIAGTARLVALPSLGGIVAKVLTNIEMDEIVEDAERVAAALTGDKGDAIVTSSELTMVLSLLRGRTSTLWKILIEPLLKDMKQNRSFLEIWDSEAPKDGEKETEKALLMANQQLTGTFTVEPAEHAKVPWPGFATTLGPSVYRCKCGFEFGDPEIELNEETARELKDARRSHFQEMFGADENGYPTETSAHFPLHRAVQRILVQSQFRSGLERTKEMEQQVAAYLRRKHRGNIHVPTIRSDIQFAIDSYLNCRKKGMPEPTAENFRVDFMEKAQLERELILRARASGESMWIDFPRTSSQADSS